MNKANCTHGTKAGRGGGSLELLSRAKLGLANPTQCGPLSAELLGPDMKLGVNGGGSESRIQSLATGRKTREWGWGHGDNPRFSSPTQGRGEILSPLLGTWTCAPVPDLARPPGLGCVVPSGRKRAQHYTNSGRGRLCGRDRGLPCSFS